MEADIPQRLRWGEKKILESKKREKIYWGRIKGDARKNTIVYENCGGGEWGKNRIKEK